MIAARAVSEAQGPHRGTLTGQVAVVTGGGRGLGRTFAQALAREGAAVAVAARSVDEIEETAASIFNAGGYALPVPLDVTDQGAVAGAIAHVHRKLGPVDLLVNNAGVVGPIGTISQTDPAAWWRTIEVNLRGVFLVAHAVVPEMVARRRGRIINVSSSAGTRPWPHVSAYAISKAAVLHFTENLAKETRKAGVKVFSIHPGIIRTPMLEETMQGEATAGSSLKLVQDGFLQRLAEGWEVPPERAADLLLLLAEGKADDLSGRYLTVHDDVSALVARADEIQSNNLYTLHLR